MARRSRDWLIGNVKKLSQDGCIPVLYNDQHVKFGSFARNTKIRPLDDIDLMICYSAMGGVYRVEKQWERYSLLMNENSGMLYDLCDDRGELNSRKVVEGLKKGLQGIDNYSKAEIHRNKEAVTLNLKSYEWSFDIVPCFYTDNGYYLIPDGDGKWKATDPRIDQKRVTETNQNQNGYLLQFIRILKYWKKVALSKNLGSYAFEQLVLDYADTWELEGDASDIHNFFAYMVSAITRTIKDPKGYQGNLNNLTIDEKRWWKKVALDAYSIAEQAIRNDKNGNNREAIDCWKEIFGNEFPKYGE